MIASISTLISHPLSAVIGWTILHSLWQGALVALALGLILSVLSLPRLRYATALVAMVVLAASWMATLLYLWPASSVRFPLASPPLPTHPSAVGFDSPQQPFSFQALIPWLAPLWMAGVSILVLRQAIGWISLDRLKTRGVCHPPPAWQQTLARLASRLRIGRPVTLLESSLVEIPVVLGHLRPVILIPVGFLAQLPVEQIEAILLHELAHIRRNDYLVNLLQRLAEAVLFYHPAVWWISHILRTEREYCCDDIAVEAHGSAYTYATALTTLEQHRSAVPEPALGATGGSLMTRIRRILEPTRPAAPSFALLPAAVLLIVAAASLAAWQADQPGPMPQQAPIEQATSGTHLPNAEEMSRMQELAARLERQAQALERQTERQTIETEARALTAKSQTLMKEAQSLQAQALELQRQAFGLTRNSPEALDRVRRQLAEADAEIKLAQQDHQQARSKVLIEERTRLERLLAQAIERPQDGAVQRDLKPPPQAPAATPGRTPYDAWVNEEVVYIISEAEHAAFLRLPTDDERKMFIEQFWLRRDPTPGTRVNEALEEHYKRIGQAMQRFTSPNGQSGWRTDRGRVWIQYGPPDELEAHASGGPRSAFPYEAWRYRHVDGAGNNIMLLFIDEKGTGDYRWTQDPNRR
jgi:GWxTD domain-containing protein